MITDERRREWDIKIEALILCIGLSTWEIEFVDSLYSWRLFDKDLTLHQSMKLREIAVKHGI